MNGLNSFHKTYR